TGEDKEDAWKAVEEYFPPVVNGERKAENLRYTRLARRGRAILYVSNHRLSEALKLYEQLANVPDAEADLKLAGIAGEALVYHRFLQTEHDRDVIDWLDDQVIMRLADLKSEMNLDQRIGSFLAKEVRQLLE